MHDFCLILTLTDNHNIFWMRETWSLRWQTWLGIQKILGVPTLVSGLHGRNFLLNQRVGRLWNFSSDVYVPFLSRFLTTLKSYYKSKGAGGLQINISKKEILSATIHLPPYAEQVKSVERIDCLLAHCLSVEHTIIEKLDSLANLKASILAQELRPSEAAWTKLIRVLNS